MTGNHLIVGGQISNAGGAAIDNVAAWGRDGSGVGRWVPMQGLNGRVHALASIDGVLYAGGEFTASVATGTIPALAINRLARWDCDRWRPVGAGFGGGVNGTVHALKARRRSTPGMPSSLILAGDFTASATGLALPRQAVYSPQSGLITPNFQAAPDGLVRAIGWRDFAGYFEAADPELGRGVLGGLFAAPSSNLCAGDGPFVGVLGNGANGQVYAAAHNFEVGVGASTETVFIGGFFTVAGGAAAPRFGKFVSVGGGSFAKQPIRGFLNGAVFALYWWGSRHSLVIAGSFTQREDAALMRRIAISADGIQDPQAVGVGLSGDVNAVCEFEGSLVAGGVFTSNGSGSPMSRVAQLVNDVTWTQLGGTGSSDPLGVSGGPVLALAEHDFGSSARPAARAAPPCGCKH